MSVNFPTSLDTLTNPTATDYLNSPSHAGQHADANDILEALEAKVGINSSAVTTSHDYKINALETNQGSGWIPAGETWTYASATTIYVPGDVTDKYQKGDKIKLTQTTAKYFYIIGVSAYDSGNDRTTLTVTGGTDYTVANAAITSPYYSKVENPQGFPHWFNYTPAFGNITLGNGTLVAMFKLQGKLVDIKISIILGSTSTVGGDAAITLPTSSISYTGTSGIPPIGLATLQDSGTATYTGFVYWQSTTTILVRTFNVGSTYPAVAALSSSVPFTWTTSDQIVLTASYILA